MSAGTRAVRTCARAAARSASLAACAGNAPQRRGAGARRREPQPRARPCRPRRRAARSDRGNPPFYDVLGKRYHVLPTSAGYVQRGVASWYGRDFHGLATSSGETYDMNAMTAAHTTLPLPTWVEVTNLVNGKRVVVKVNDRGPFVDNRLIDLVLRRGHGARHGAAPVRRASRCARWRRRCDASRAARPWLRAAALPPAAPRPCAAASIERMFVQIGAFSQRENAERLVARLRASGFANPTVVSEPDNRRTLHRVRLGPIARLRRVRSGERAPARDRRVGLAARRGSRAMSRAATLRASRLRGACARRRCGARVAAQDAAVPPAPPKLDFQEPLSRRFHDRPRARGERAPTSSSRPRASRS